MKPKSIQVPRKRPISWGLLALVAIISGVLGGAVALAMVALMLWLCNRSWSVDDADSHGISEFQSSRLGGIAVFLGGVAFFSVTDWVTRAGGGSFGAFTSAGDELPSYVSFALLIGLVGLWDDFVARFKPTPRLVLVLAISMGALLSDAVPMTASAYVWLPFGLNNSFALFMAGTLVVTGFVNAGNMADGANGLLGIVGLSFFCVLMSHGGASFASIFIMSLLIFLVFNVVTGKIFLGDFGAYGLSAMIAFGSLELYSVGTVSSWFFGSLLAYPCIEMVRVIIVRSLQGSSPFEASNDHLHNYCYAFLRNRGWNRLVANSTTGCLLGAASALVPASLVLFGVLDPSSTATWGGYFAIYLVLHLFLVLQLRRVVNEE